MGTPRPRRSTGVRSTFDAADNSNILAPSRSEPDCPHREASLQGAREEVRHRLANGVEIFSSKPDRRVAPAGFARRRSASSDGGFVPSFFRSMPSRGQPFDDPSQERFERPEFCSALHAVPDPVRSIEPGSRRGKPVVGIQGH